MNPSAPMAFPSGLLGSSKAIAYLPLSSNKNAAITGRYFSMSTIPYNYRLPFYYLDFAADKTSGEATKRKLDSKRPIKEEMMSKEARKKSSPRYETRSHTSVLLLCPLSLSSCPQHDAVDDFRAVSVDIFRRYTSSSWLLRTQPPLKSKVPKFQTPPPSPRGSVLLSPKALLFVMSHADTLTLPR